MVQADLIAPKQILQNKAKQKKNMLLTVILTYNKTLQNISEVLSNSCHFVPINSKFRNVFNNDKPTIAFKKENSS